MSAEPIAEAESLPRQEWTVDELAALFGLTVRTCRYYASLGLVPPPTRRGRMAYYDERHRARLQLVRTLQEQGMTLGSIENHLRRLPADTPPVEIELRRALMSGWAPARVEVLSREDLHARAGRTLSEEEIGLLENLGSIARNGDSFEARPTIDVGLGLLDLDISVPSMQAANDAIRHHMETLALELREILRTQVWRPVQQGEPDPAAFTTTMARLRQLTLQAVVTHFQEATNGLVDGSLLRHSHPTKDVRS